MKLKLNQTWIKAETLQSIIGKAINTAFTSEKFILLKKDRYFFRGTF